MNRTVILVLVFLLLGGAAYYTFQKSQQSRASAELTWDRDFKIEDTDKVYKIFLADKRNRTATLEKQADGSWILDGERRMIDQVPRNMLEVMEKVEYQYLLGEAESKNVIERMITSSIKVEMYDKRDENIITFYIGPNGRDHEGSYFLKEGSEYPQIVNMPGFVGELRPRFEIKRMAWWDKHVFLYEKDEIEEVSVFYPKQKSKSFKLTKDGGSWNVNPLDPLVSKSNREVNQDIVNLYLEAFEKKGSEAIRNEFSKRDSVTAIVPFAEVAVKTKSGAESKKVSFIPVYYDLRDDEAILTQSSEVERMWANTEGGDLYMTQLRVFAPIFRSYQSFFGK